MDTFNICISTENGTGSLTANRILLRSLLKAGLHVSSKNLFPSNIAGLPTLYKLRISKKNWGSVSNEEPCRLYVSFNKKTIASELETFSDTFFIYNADFKTPEPSQGFGLNCRKLVKELHPSASVRKLLYNMLYVGATLKALGVPLEHAQEATQSVLKKLKPEALNANLTSLSLGHESFTSHSPFLGSDFFQTSKTKLQVMDSNTAAALGFLDSGAQVLTWYPITPSSSVAETFEHFNQKTQHPQNRSILQCEDEISSVVTALGAGWSGARAFTATSGPGISLMQESIGLGYFAEIPFVILNVQRMGPSTGLPTRTSQGDLALCHYSSHGDTLHPVFLPSNPQEVYDDCFDSINLAQELQTPVFVLTDLDLGMNEWSGPTLTPSTKELSNGDIQKKFEGEFKRYNNSDLVPRRSLPRLGDKELAYFTRGTGHDEYGVYSEDPKVYSKKLTRLKNKILKFRSLSKCVPQDIVNLDPNTSTGLIFYGSSSQIIEELKEQLGPVATYQVRALPLNENLKDFVANHKKVFVIEQNRDGQLNQIIKGLWGCPNITSIVQFDGQPIDPVYIAKQIKTFLS